MDSSFKYFLSPHSKKYMVFENHSGIQGFNVFFENGKIANILDQAGTSELSVTELMEAGQLIEIHKQVRDGKRTYDAHALWSKDQKRYHNI